jgi:bifunctional oligoribonuclease and PAP phosphatase NrnA
MASPAANGFSQWPVGSAPAESIAAILELLRQGERFLVCSHTRPDGDAVGSMLAMGMLLEQMGKHVDLVAADRVPPLYRTLPGAERIRSVLRVRGLYDAAILLECDSLDRARVRGLEPYFHINIDHHATGRNFGNLNWIDHEATSAGEMVHRLIQASGATLTPEMARCLYVTILTDTGGFCYGGVRERTFTLAAELTRAGADPIGVARDIYFAVPESKLHLLGAALSNLHREGPLAWLWVTHADMLRSGASEEDCEGVVNYAITIAGVESAAFLRELPEGRIRLSLRSKTKIDVAAIAASLGGGGHENAAGVTLDGPMEQATERILGVLRAALREADSREA